jgi:hypothetical protein
MTKKKHALSTFVSHEFTNIIKALNINLVAWILALFIFVF